MEHDTAIWTLWITWGVGIVVCWLATAWLHFDHVREFGFSDSEFGWYVPLALCWPPILAVTIMVAPFLGASALLEFLGRRAHERLIHERDTPLEEDTDA